MLIWSGYGFIVPLMVAVIFFIVVIIGGLLGVPADYPGGLGFLLAAAACWWGGRRLNDPQKDRVLRDESSGEMVVLRSRHTLFWIPVQWWAVPCLIGAVAIVLPSF